MKHLYPHCLSRHRHSVRRVDYTMTQALVLLVSFAFIFMNFLIDLLYAWLDPRIRYHN